MLFEFSYRYDESTMFRRASNPESNEVDAHTDEHILYIDGKFSEPYKIRIKFESVFFIFGILITYTVFLFHTLKRIITHKLKIYMVNHPCVNSKIPILKPCFHTDLKWLQKIHRNIANEEDAIEEFPMAHNIRNIKNQLENCRLRQ